MTVAAVFCPVRSPDGRSFIVYRGDDFTLLSAQARTHVLPLEQMQRVAHLVSRRGDLALRAAWESHLEADEGLVPLEELEVPLALQEDYALYSRISAASEDPQAWREAQALVDAFIAVAAKLEHS